VGVVAIIQQDDGEMIKKNIFIYYIKMSLNTAEICVFYKQPQNLTFANKPSQPTQPIPTTSTTNNDTIHRMMPM
jgi:hypothetical protein